MANYSSLRMQWHANAMLNSTLAKTGDTIIKNYRLLLRSFLTNALVREEPVHCSSTLSL